MAFYDLQAAKLSAMAEREKNRVANVKAQELTASIRALTRSDARVRAGTRGFLRALNNPVGRRRDPVLRPGIHYDTLLLVPAEKRTKKPFAVYEMELAIIVALPYFSLHISAWHFLLYDSQHFVYSNNNFIKSQVSD